MSNLNFNPTPNSIPTLTLTLTLTHIQSNNEDQREKPAVQNSSSADFKNIADVHSPPAAARQTTVDLVGKFSNV